MADNPKEPYGDVKYADPGYQADKKKRYPLDTEAHVRAAWSYINQADNAAEYDSDQLANIKGRIRAAAERVGVQISDDDEADRAVQPDRPTYMRDWVLDDIEILSRGKGGDGRTVEAYATPFDVEQEIHDQNGDYIEVIDRTAFNRTLSHGIDKVGVYYHHAMTLHGTPSDLGSVPIGRPLQITPDGRGLRTVSRYNKSELADSVLEAIRNGDIRGQSFRGRIYRSDPQRVPRSRGGKLPLVRRLELGLTEYGPTPTPYYEDAKITAVRAAGDIMALPADERRELIRILSTTTPQVPVIDDSATPDLGLGAEDSPNGHSDRLSKRLRLRSRATLLGA